MSLVSKHFNNLSKDTIKKLNLNNIIHQDYEYVEKFLSHSKYLKELCISVKGCISRTYIGFDNYVSLIKICLQSSSKYLKTLKIAELDSQFDDTCKYILDYGPNIEHLEIGTYLPDEYPIAL